MHLLQHALMACCMFTPAAAPIAAAPLPAQGIVQGIDGLLIPKADAKPAGRRLQQKQLWGNFDKVSQSSVTLLRWWAACAWASALTVCCRHALRCACMQDNKQQYSAPARSGSVQDNPATTFAPSNTGGALSASAKKNTQWNTVMKLNSFANAGKGSRQCYNCGAWQ